MGRPGRPPLGKRAMTGLERLHRHRAKLRASKPETKTETKSAGPPDAALAKKLAQAEARIAELERELERARRASKPETKTETKLDRHDGGALAQELAQAQARIMRLEKDRDAWKAAYDRLEDRYRLRPRIMCRPELHRQIRACLHPDRAGEASAKWFREFEAVEFIEIKPRPKLGLPDTKEELMAAGRRAAAERSAKAKAAAARRKK